MKNAVPGDSVGLAGTVTIAGTATGVQPITSFTGASLNNQNYTLTGGTGSVYIGTANLVLDKVVYGSATITPSGLTTTITQTSNTAIIDWLRFSIGSNEAVNFVQPSASSVVLNRVTGNEKSVIDGVLTATGLVFIVNSNGILFSKSSEVNVGGLVASTLGISDTGFENGLYQFATAGATGTVATQGVINAANGSFIVLASGEGVTTSGYLSAPGGTEVIAATKNMTLTPDLTGTSPVLTSYALSNLSGVANVGGNLNAAGTATGGQIETSGDTVTLADDLVMHTGPGGTWTFGQNADITVGPGGIGAPFVENALGTGNFNLTSYQGAISINDPVTWSANTVLTLGAATNININAKIQADGTTAGLVMNYGGFGQTGQAAAGYDYIINSQIIDSQGGITRGPAEVTLPNATESLTINGQAYTLIESVDQLAALGSGYIRDSDNARLYDTSYQCCILGGSGYIALGQDLTATQTYAGPLLANFAGTLAGLGHTINNFTIVDTGGNSGDGLIGNIGATGYSTNTYNYETLPGTVRDLGLTNLSISGQGMSGGGLAASSAAGSVISNVYVMGSITAGTDASNSMGDTGGLVGDNNGLINNAPRRHYPIRSPVSSNLSAAWSDGHMTTAPSQTPRPPEP